jgi:hypothetical protein
MAILPLLWMHHKLYKEQGNEYREKAENARLFLESDDRESLNIDQSE